LNPVKNGNGVMLMNSSSGSESNTIQNSQNRD
jgi:hypothetical protein